MTQLRNIGDWGGTGEVEQGGGKVRDEWAYGRTAQVRRRSQDPALARIGMLGFVPLLSAAQFQ